MSRSGYSEDFYDISASGRWRGQVTSAIRGKRGQGFLLELAREMDAMPEKVLIAEELISEGGACCTMGVICKARELDVRTVDETDADTVGEIIGIASQLAREIAYENDEGGADDETPADRWVRMRKWVGDQIKKESAQ